MSTSNHYQIVTTHISAHILAIGYCYELLVVPEGDQHAVIGIDGETWVQLVPEDINFLRNSSLAASYLIGVDYFSMLIDLYPPPPPPPTTTTTTTTTKQMKVKGWC
jgi:hypothetical protein